nr:MAG TPA: hypothetical protein [Caudoviricetes sp.]
MLLIILFWFVLIPVVIFQSKINNKKKNIFLIIYGIFFIIFIFNITSTPDEKSNLKKNNSETINTNQIKSDNNVKTENKNSDTQETEKKFEPRIIKNKETGEFIIQVYVPETATHDEIYKIIMDIQQAKRKDFLNDNIVIVAYSDEDYINKRLLGTHAQWEMEHGVTKYMKIYPKTEKLTPEDKKNFLEYLQLVEALQDTGDDLKKSKLEAGKLMKARHPENYSDIIKRAEKYFYGIEKEKTEEEKLKDQINNPDPNSDYQKFKKEQEKKEKSGGNK